MKRPDYRWSPLSYAKGVESQTSPYLRTSSRNGQSVYYSLRKIIWPDGTGFWGIPNLITYMIMNPYRL